MTMREVGTLSAADIGKQVRIEFEGWVHTGTLTKAEHEEGFRTRVRSYIALKYESGARWSKAVEVDQLIEVRDEI